MVKVKIFNFEVSNPSFKADEKDSKEEWCRKLRKDLVEYNTIEKILNDFLLEKTLIKLTANTVDVKFHNNGRANYVQLVYTIVYSE